MSRQNIATECRENKHRYCQGKAWHPAVDDLGECQCDCHSAVEPQGLPFQVTVYTKSGSCGQCDSTKRYLDRAGIPYQERVVHPHEKSSVDELKLIAQQKGVAPSMPFVMVLDDDTEDIHSWFGFQPAEIDKLKARRSA